MASATMAIKATAAAETAAEIEVFAQYFCGAAENGFLSVLRALLAGAKAPADINATRASDGATPLFVAAKNGRLETVRELLSQPKIDVNAVRTVTNATALCAAAQFGKLAIVKQLLAHPGVAVNKATFDGATPLYLAVQQGHREVVKLLLAVPGIALNAQLTPEGCGPSGATPLFVAAQNKFQPIVQDLLTAGADLDAPSFDGKTVRTHAMEGRRFPEAINRILLTHVAPFSAFVAKQLLELAVIKDAVCPITFEPIKAGKTTVMSCGHLFVRDALVASFATLPNVCPVCRAIGSKHDV